MRCFEEQVLLKFTELQLKRGERGREGRKILPLGCVLKADSVYLDIKEMEEDAPFSATTL